MSGKLPLLVLWISVLVATTAAASPPEPPAGDYQVVYTGRLFGYFRYPEVQDLELRACPAAEASAGPLSAIDEELLRQFALPAGGGTTVRVAVGDNFAPFLLARQVRQGSELKGKENFRETDLPVDNVGCFLQLLGLDAIVPGEHDFYFGPERLRYLARALRRPQGELLRADGARLAYRPLRMLGANLSVRTRAVDPRQPLQGAEQSGQISRQQARSPEDPFATLPPVVLPWMRTIRIRNAFRLSLDGRPRRSDAARALLRSARFTRAEAEAFNAQVRSGAAAIGPIADQRGSKYEFRRAFSGACIARRGEAASGCAAAAIPLVPVVRAASEEYRLAIDIDYALPPGRLLAADEAYVLVLSRPEGAVLRQDFQVQPAYFESPLTSAEKGQRATGDVKPWACIAGQAPGSVKVAVFGVVDAGMAEFIGRLNDTWRGADRDPRHETDLQVSDPAEALQQVLDYFGETGDCPGARKVLLAQMPQHKLPEIIARLHAAFDVVIAAADPDLASGDKNIVERFDSRVDDRASVEPLILVPGSHFSSEDPYGVRVRVQRVAVRDRAQAALAGLIRRESAGFVLDRGPAFHPVPLESHAQDLERVAGREVTVTGTPVLEGSGAHGRIQRLAVAGIAEGAGEERRLVTIEREFRNAITRASAVIEVDPFDALRRHGVVSPESTLAEWTGRLPEKERAKLPAIPEQDAPGDVWKSFLEDLSLLTMQEECHADMALLQHRDVFFAAPEFRQPVNAAGIYAMVNAMLWKGDFIQCMNLTGASINSLLARSRELQDAENRGLATDLSHGWSLATLGADSGQNNPAHRLVNEQWLDPRKLYSVAVTDYLANGDTGYPALQSGEPPPYTPLADLALRPLSGCVAARLLAAKPNLSARDQELARQWCGRSRDTLDELVGRPKPSPAPRPGFLGWLSGWRPADRFQTKGVERAAQERTFWTIDLYRAAASYTLFVHSGTEGQVANRFPGITVADLSAPQASSLTFDYFGRATRDADTWQFYLESELNYGHRAQRGKPTGSTGLADPAYQVSQSANYWYQEAGYARRFSPAHRGPSGWRVLAPVGLRTQLEPQILQIVPPGGASSAVVQPPRSARNFFVAFRPGLRYEYSFPRPPVPGRSFISGGAQSPYTLASGQGQGSRGGGQALGGNGQTLRATLDSFIEFGYEVGEIFHQPSAFRFADGTCFANGLSACLAAPPVTLPGDSLLAVISGRNRLQQGLYLNFRFNLPLPLYTGSELAIDNRGDFFANQRNDTQVDPRFLEDLRSALVLPIYGKFSLAPTLELFFFQNKIAQNYYHSYSTFVALNYSFDWHTGLSWKKVLGFANPVPALQALPTR